MSFSPASVAQFHDLSTLMGVNVLSEMPKVQLDGPYGAPAQVILMISWGTPYCPMIDLKMRTRTSTSSLPQLASLLN